MPKLTMYVACTNANGEGDLFQCEVEVTEEECSLGKHYDKAEALAEDEGYEAPFVCFDPSEYSNLTRNLGGLVDGVTFSLEDSSGSEAEALKVNISQAGAGLALMVSGHEDAVSEEGNAVVAVMENDAGTFRVIAYEDKQQEEPTSILNFKKALRNS